ncbi:aldose epimerase family protein [Ensifer soli]|uniref:aldose epimerase family protein n=1 Tax=Ciceribacter sp. sgz301302 TaxID=3342379 RepID=UPI0035BA2512
MREGNTVFGRLPSGETVERLTLRGGGLTARILTFGAVIQDLRLDGHAPPLVLGLNTLEDYLVHSPYFGATPGRCSNRIAGGRFTIDGKAYQLELNENGVTHLHGGENGIARRNWTIAAQTDNAVTLTVTDPDGQAGYPGACTTTCTYSLEDGGVLSVTYDSESDKPTPCNICQHSYFNLDGAPDALDHEIEIPADHYIPTDALQIPTGEVLPVEGTVFDLRSMTPLRRQTEGDRVLYDHTFPLSLTRTPKRLAARVRSHASGVTLEVRTGEPGMHLYTGFKMDLAVPGLEGRRYGPFAGFCLETQTWPDAINHPNFPDAVLRPGKVLRQETDYIFRKG